MDSTSRKSPVDIQFERHGMSVVLIRALTAAGEAWLKENVGDSETQHFGGAIVAEPRFCEAIAYGAHGAGLLCDATLVRS
jgi:hypothetical protein